MPTTRQLVTFDRHVQLLNDEIHTRPEFTNGMRFVNTGTGFNLIAEHLSWLEKTALMKSVSDAVSRTYVIAEEDR